MKDTIKQREARARRYAARKDHSLLPSNAFDAGWKAAANFWLKEYLTRFEHAESGEGVECKMRLFARDLKGYGEVL